MDADRLRRTGASSTAARAPERQRGRWNFQTWPVLLIEILAAQQFVGSGARAAQEDTGAESTKSDPAALFANGNLPANPDSQSAASDARERDVAGNAGHWSSGSQDDEPSALNTLASQAGQENAGSASQSGSGTSLASGVNGSEGAYKTDSAPSSYVSEPIAGDAGSLFPDLNYFTKQIELTHLINDLFDQGAVIDLGLAQRLVEQVHTSGGSAAEVLEPTLDQITGLHLVDNAGGVLGPLSDALGDKLSQVTGLHLAEDAAGFDVALSQVSSGLTELHGGTLQDALWGNSIAISLTAGSDAVESSVPSVASIVAADEETPLHDIGAISSAGTISFQELSPSSHADELFAGGRYTDYNLTLQSDANPSMDAITNTFDTNPADALPPTAKATDMQPDHSPLSNDHDLDTSLASLTSTEQELGIRDFAM